MIDTSKFVNHFELSDRVLDTFEKCREFAWAMEYAVKPYDIPVDSFHMFESLLLPQEVDALLADLSDKTWQAVGKYGRSDIPYDKAGNYRLSSYSKVLAEHLWERLGPFLSDIREMNSLTPTDFDGHRRWKPIGVSPLFRFIKYESDGELVAHYDASYVESDTRRTLMSLVIYLNHCDPGGTRFLNDPQSKIPVIDRNLDDWDRVGKDDEVIFTAGAWPGNAVVFDHRLLHDSAPLSEGDTKIIIRTDIMFEKC